jgi:hypothetical protein
MNALFKQIAALALCGACSGGAPDDEAAASPPPSSSSASSSALTDGTAGEAGEVAAPLPLTEEELERLLDALEQEIGRRK